jgi:hypothetical protein
MLRPAAAPIAAIGRAACLPGGGFEPRGDAIARLPAGRSVTCDLPGGAPGQRTRQVRRADGTTTVTGRAALREGR